MRVALLSIAFALAVAAPALAEHCTTWSTSATNEDMIVVDIRDAAFGAVRYIVSDTCNVPRYNPDGDGIHVTFGHEFAHVPAPVDEPTCIFSIWLYYESNGVAGLQRGDEVVDDSCHSMIESDYFVW